MTFDYVYLAIKAPFVMAKQTKKRVIVFGKCTLLTFVGAIKSEDEVFWNAATSFNSLLRTNKLNEIKFVFIK